MGMRSNKVLFNLSTASTGEWFPLDSRYEEYAQRAIMGTVTTGDTVILEGTTADIEVNSAAATALAALTAADITTLGSYTANFNDILNGNWTWIRVRKTGTAGVAKVQGNI